MSERGICWAFWYKVRGLHVHMRVVSGPVGTTRAKCGDLVMRVDEFERFRAALLRGATELENFRFINEDASEK